MARTILIMAGGTGGHVFPGLAVADALKNQQWTIHWLGTVARMEAQLVPQAGYPIHFIDVAGVRGNGIIRKLKAPWQILKSVWQARRVIKQIQPDLVLGMGGFASGPGGIAAKLAKVPLILHEQNALPGITNKILARFATRILTGFANTFELQRSGDTNYLWVGNPVRTEFAQVAELQAHDKPLKVLVVGGSLGAQVLNEVVPKALRKFPHCEVFHQCGKGHKSAVDAAYQACGIDTIRWNTTEFIGDMAQAYEQADVVICRAGALTVAEVAMAGRVAIFVPLPHAVDDHQTLNAQALSREEAAYLLPQPDFNAKHLAKLLERLHSHPQERLEMARKARALAKPDATERVVQICQQIVEDAA